ncbi:unnamed protein product, partial [Didymodactylos carnosus]
NKNNDKSIIATIINEEHEETLPNKVFPTEKNGSERKSLDDNNLTIRYRTYSDIFTYQTLINTSSRISRHHSDPLTSSGETTPNQRLHHSNPCSRCQINLHNERAISMSVGRCENRFYHYRGINKRLRRPPSYIKELKAYLAHREASVTDIVSIKDMKKISNVLVWLAKQPTPLLQRQQSFSADSSPPLNVSASSDPTLNERDSRPSAVENETVVTSITEIVSLSALQNDPLQQPIFSTSCHSGTPTNNRSRNKAIESAWGVSLRPQQDRQVEKIFHVDMTSEQRQQGVSIEQNTIDNINPIRNDQSCSTTNINISSCLNQQNSIIESNNNERELFVQLMNKNVVDQEEDSVIINEISQYSDPISTTENVPNEINTKFYGKPSSIHIMYDKVPWSLHIRKEVFSPCETLEQPLLIDLIFIQILRDTFSPTCVRINNEERLSMKALLATNGVTSISDMDVIKKLSTKKSIVEQAKQWQTYFCRLFPISNLHFTGFDEQCVVLDGLIRNFEFSHSSSSEKLTTFAF